MRTLAVVAADRRWGLVVVVVVVVVVVAGRSPSPDSSLQGRCGWEWAGQG
jgi:hypothetical protein